MHTNEEIKQRAILIAVNMGSYDVEASLDELEELTETAGAEVVSRVVQNLQSPNNATYIGQGKLLEVKEFAEQQGVNLLIFDDELSGAQIRNIEDAVGIDVIDRTMLILDIFAQRALSNEGKLQVELAQQKYLLPRLYGMGKQLSKQQGGIGSRGPGESKLESDKRHIRRRIDSLEAELKELSERRVRVRERRAKNDIATIAIVGYTNVGKSTLLNLLTDAGVLVKDMLFATLDPTARALTLPDGQTALLIDTVGLLRRLPHQLINAFKSTLEEAANADLILNLCDISNENVSVQLEVTRSLIDELGGADIPTLTVYNKIDKVDYENVTPINDTLVFISATENRGIEALLNRIAKCLSESMKKLTLLIPYNKSSLLDVIRRNGKILSEEYQNDGTLVTVSLDVKVAHQVEEYIVS
ncbi:MAG: GTPase HflX [Oscillospiraceae bacterium]